MDARFIAAVALATACVMPLAGVHADQGRGATATGPVPASDGTAPLHWATYKQDVAAVERLLRKGADPNTRNAYGVTPLSLAATTGDVTIIEKLLKAGADPNASVRSGETPLMLASRAGAANAVELLLTHKANVNAKETFNGQTALMWAAAEGHAPTAKVLVEHGADVNARSNRGTTPLLFAVRRGSMDTVRVLLAAGADVKLARSDNATALLTAIVNGHEDIVDLLLELGADPNIEGGLTEITHPGVRAKAYELTFRQLTDSEQDREGHRPGNLFGTPLHAAVHMGNWEFGDVSVGIKLDRIRVIKALIKHGANVNAKLRTEEPRWDGQRYRRHLTGATPFVLAAKAADIEVMRLLLANGADPNIVTKERTTALMAAAGIAWASSQDRATEAQALDAVKLIVEELGADVNYISDRGETAMHGAAYRGANTIVQYLFDKGARLDVVAKDGRTPLIIADGVEYGNGFAAQPHTAVLLRELLEKKR
jgi:ankyrin repeat protein